MNWFAMRILPCTVSNTPANTIFDSIQIAEPNERSLFSYILISIPATFILKAYNNEFQRVARIGCILIGVVLFLFVVIWGNICAENADFFLFEHIKTDPKGFDKMLEKQMILLE